MKLPTLRIAVLQSVPFAFVAFTMACGMGGDDQPPPTIIDDETSIANNTLFDTGVLSSTNVTATARHSQFAPLKTSTFQGTALTAVTADDSVTCPSGGSVSAGGSASAYSMSANTSAADCGITEPGGGGSGTTVLDFSRCATAVSGQLNFQLDTQLQTENHPGTFRQAVTSVSASIFVSSPGAIFSQNGSADVENGPSEHTFANFGFMSGMPENGGSKTISVPIVLRPGQSQGGLVRISYNVGSSSLSLFAEGDSSITLGLNSADLFDTRGNKLPSPCSACGLQRYTAGTRFTGSQIWADRSFFPSLDAINAAAADSGVFVHVTSSFRLVGHTVDGAIRPPAQMSNHLAGHAIDMNVEYTDANGARVSANSAALSRNPLPAPVADFIAAVKNAGLRWGGDFQGKDRDPVHFDDALNVNDPATWQSIFDADQACAADAGFVVRVHSPVNVLITDPAGRVLGVDDAGNPVNSIGANAFDSGPGEPRTFAIKKPLAGQYAMRLVGTGSGPYTVELFNALDISAPLNAIAPIDEARAFSGNAIPGSVRNVSFALAPDQNQSIQDITPPQITASVTPSMLWPPNGKSVDVTVSGAIVDDLSGVDVTSGRFQVIDDYGLVQPTGDVVVAADGSFAFSVPLVASRNGTCPAGRHYSITITAEDNDGNVGRSATLVVTVPHDQRK